MKRSTSFRLSDAALSAVRDRAQALGLSQTDIVEQLILRELTRSTPDEQRQQSRKRHDALRDFTRDHPQADARRAWQAGFATGWLQYQSRRSLSVD